MKNKLIIGTITVFVGIISNIIFLNFHNSDTQQNNNFKRNFSKNEILIFNKSNKRLNSKNEFINKIPSTDSILEFQNCNNDDAFQDINIVTADINFLNKKSKNVKLPLSSEILCVNKELIIFSYKSKICIFNSNTGKLKLEIFKNLQIFSLIPFSENSNKYLCFGELFQNNVFNTGFYMVDLSSEIITISKILKTEVNSTFIESRLQYTGYFQKQNENLLSYNFEMFSKIFFFNNNGFFEKELNTKDKTKLPKIVVRNNIEFTYSNDGKGYSNVGLFCKTNIFMFSQWLLV